jgi:hypothetical protein
LFPVTAISTISRTIFESTASVPEFHRRCGKITGTGGGLP